MNKSFKKIINLEENISINDLKEALECFITIEDEKLKEEFLSKCKRVIISLVNNLLPLVDEYPTSLSYNETIFTLNRLLFYANFLYGSSIFPLFSKNVQTIKDNSLYLDSISRYRSNVNKDLFNDKELIINLDIYNKEKELKTKYSNISKDILEEAYNLYFSLKDLLDKEDYDKRKKLFMEKNNIYPDILKDYVETYGYIYLNIPLKKLSKMINSVDIAANRISSMSCLEEDINKIIDNDDTNCIKDIVFTRHLSPYVIKSFIEKFRFFESKYTSNLDSIIKKVNNAISSLAQEHKYIHYSILFSKLEETNDRKEIIEIIKNNNDKFLTIEYINYFISVYRITLTKDDKDKLKNSILDKIKNAKKSLKEEKENNKIMIEEITLKSAFDNIDFKLFLNDNISNINDFCSLMNITRNELNKCFTLLKDVDNELYFKINEKMRNLQGQRYAVLINKVNSIADNIINGIELEDGRKRNFEILDYFLSTKLDFNDFINLYNKNRNIDIESLRAIKTFFAKNKLTNKLNIKQELNGTTIFMIDDSPYEVSKEEKQAVLNYLRFKDIPLYIKVYKQALKKYVNGDLILEDGKKYVKKG